MRAGEQIPVDCRVVKSIDLQINEASLTGESNPVFKNNHVMPADTALADRKNMVYAGTVVVEVPVVGVVAGSLPSLPASPAGSDRVL